ncbi:ecto-ADP-ribosyltransferase 5-like isoform X1 [Oncorhynchus masou masou]|uniref:ecto-ADP-ribosyltransferase 5-like isoform X1 n=2 Tax=Oncorhynchus masou masou TaxID=90313 RepID=UPI003183361A
MEINNIHKKKTIVFSVIFLLVLMVILVLIFGIPHSKDGETENGGIQDGGMQNGGIQDGGMQEILPLDMVRSSVDDKYDGCRDLMLWAVENMYLFDELNTNPQFNTSWNIAKPHAIPHGDSLNTEHSIAIYLYTKNIPGSNSKSMYLDFNKAVQEGHSAYMTTSFRYHALHFYLTDAIQILRERQETCKETFHRTNKKFDQNVLNQEIRFGTFTTSSLRSDLANFGNVSCFEINTCFGAELTSYSAFPEEREVLIPPYEIFEVTKIQTKSPVNNLLCEVIYTLKSKGVDSDLNCKMILSGGESNIIRASDTGYIILHIMMITTVYY